MLSVASALLSRFALAESISRRDALALVIITLLHLSALVVMAATELDLASQGDIPGHLGAVEFFLARCPAEAFDLRLARRSGMIVALILLSQFKYDKLMMTVNFVDLMIIDPDTSAFLFTIMPRLARAGHRGCAGGDSAAGRSLAALIPSAFVCARVRLAALLCMGALVVLSRPIRPIFTVNSSPRLRVEVRALGGRGGLRIQHAWAPGVGCDRRRSVEGAGRGVQPGRKTSAHHPAARRVELRHHRGARHQGAAGLRGISSRSTARRARWWSRRRRPELVHRVQRADRLVGALVWPLRHILTRIAAGHVARGLPNALRRCGYKTFSLYPGLWRVPRRARLPDHAPASSIIST